jgi:hypothetical protein
MKKPGKSHGFTGLIGKSGGAENGESIVLLRLAKSLSNS